MTTPKLLLPELSTSQAQKEITHNTALQALDALCQCSVVTKGLATPPGSPTNGALYIVAASPTGAWAGYAGQIAQWYAGAWYFYPPVEGWQAWVVDELKNYRYTAGAWSYVVPGLSGTNFVLTFHYSGLAIQGDMIIDGILMPAAVNINKVGIFAREAPTGSALTVDLTKNQAAQSRTATLAMNAVKQTTAITATPFLATDEMGVQITGVGSTTPGDELTVTLSGTYQ